jgi:hypothetical protein
MPRHLFAKGHPKLPNSGRRKGTPNKATRAVKDFLRDCANNPDVQDAFEAQLVRGGRGAMQAFLGVAAFVIGKPKEQVAVESPSLGKLWALALRKQQEADRAQDPAYTPKGT